MTIQKICESYHHMYICVKNCTYGYNKNPNLIKSAIPFYIYPTLDKVKKDKEQILSMMKEYKDFDIIYGDLKHYMEVRKDRLPIIKEVGGIQNLTSKSVDKLIFQIK